MIHIVVPFFLLVMMSQFWIMVIFKNKCFMYFIEWSNQLRGFKFFFIRIK